MRFVLASIVIALSLSLSGCAALGITPPPTNGRTPYQDMLNEKNKGGSSKSGNEVGTDLDSQVSVPEGTNQADFNGMQPPEDFLGESTDESDDSDNSAESNGSDNSNSSDNADNSDESDSDEKSGSSHKKPPVFVDKYNIGNTSNSDHDAEKFSDAEKFVRRLTVSDVNDIAFRLQLTQLSHDLSARDGFYDGHHMTSVDAFNYFIGLNAKRTYTLEREYRYRGEQYNYMIPVADIVSFIENDFQWEEFDVGTEEFKSYMESNGILLNMDKLYFKEWPSLPEVNATYKLYKSVPITFNKVRLIFQAIESDEGISQSSDEDTTLALPNGSDTVVDSDVADEVNDASNKANDASNKVNDDESSSEIADSPEESTSSVVDTESNSSTSSSEYKYYPVLEIELSNMDDFKFLEFWTNRNK